MWDGKSCTDGVMAAIQLLEWAWYCKLFLLTLLLPIASVSAAIDASTLDIHTVECNHTTTSCECRQDADVCVFSLQIELLHSFTRYIINPQFGERVQLARVYYFGDDGNLYGHPGHLHQFCRNVSENDVNECTPAYTFDGSTFRYFIGVNGQVPGPALIVWENQTVVAKVSNELQLEAVSIHWHGMFQRNTYFMDGVHHITQNPIDPQRSFCYIFKAIPSGTHWYHSHTGVQCSDGLFGALIVRERPFIESQIRNKLPTALQQYQDIPAEHTVVIADWFRGYAIDEHQLWVVGTDGFWVAPVAVDYITLHSGERYDFLLITKIKPAKNDFWMRAEAQEIDVEGNVAPTGPLPYRLLLDHAAEAILHYNTPGSSLPTSADYVRIKENSRPINSTCTSSNRCKMMNCPWNIHPAYNLQCIYVDSLRLLLPSSEDILPKATPDEEIFFNFGAEGVQFLSAVNGRRTTFPSIPPKLTVDDQEFQEIVDREYCKNLDNRTFCNNARFSTITPECQCVHMINLEHQKSYRFVYTVAGPQGAFSHPIHMHGHSFFIVKIGLPPINNTTGFVECFSEDLDCASYPPWIRKCDYVTGPGDYTCSSQWAVGREYTYPSPTTSGMTPSPTSTGKIDPYTPRKDTITVPAGGYAIVDVVADNPGIWFMHCHVEPHAVEGMAVTLNEAQPNQNPSPPEMRQHGNFEPTLQDFYNNLDFDPNRPSILLQVCAPFVVVERIPMTYLLLRSFLM